jgi:Family of unknown function (DUF6529)
MTTPGARDGPSTAVRLAGIGLLAAGGALALLVAVLWYTSALWYYNGYQLPGA